MSNSLFRTVTIAGATGTLGYHIAEAFLNDGSYNVKVLRRNPESANEKANLSTSKEKSESANEKANLLASKGAEIVYADYSQKDDLVNALKGTDVLISAVSGMDLYAVQSPLLATAKEAHVKRFIPSEFDSGINHSFQDSKVKFRKDVEKSGLEYTFILTGIFQEYLGLLGFDVKNKKAKFYVDGDKKLSATSLADIGRYTVESLKVPEARNAYIRVAGDTLSLNEILQKFEEASGSKWQVTEDKELRHRFRNNIDPVPTMIEDFGAAIMENGYFEKTDNDKFSFTPRSITETINLLVKQA